MDIRQALKKYPAKIEGDLLLAHVLKQPKEFLYIEANRQLTQAQISKLSSLVNKRKKGMPIAYLLGYKYFCNLKFKVTQDVLIPRPETEWLVNESLKLIKVGSKILEVGTGSGCIAISIRKNTLSERTHIWASDISSKALKIAKYNAKNLMAKVKFYQSDLLKNVPSQFDIIIANLPYVPATDYKKLKNNLRYEPKSAITDGTNDFKIYKRFFSEVAKHLKPNATILLEIDPNATSFLKTYCKKYLPTRQIAFFKDLKGLVRYAKIR